jgi:5S rRNA maturation endonuclease (ribonuclease M5)
MRDTRLPSQEWTEKMDIILRDLVTDANTGTPVLVEGRKDEVALRALGIQGPIHCIHYGGYRLFEVAEQLAHYKRVILLTDFDDQGKKLSKKLRNYLEKRCKVDLEHWSKMKHVFRRLIKDVESLSSVVPKLQLPNQYALCQD